MSRAFLEIERRFLVRSRSWPQPASTHAIRQAYLTRQGGLSVRIRQIDDRWVLTIKVGLSAAVRHEYELPVDADMGAAMLRDACTRPPVEKTRHCVMVEGQRWDVDVFSGANAGLVLAEAELEHADQALAIPDWVGPEVTNDARFNNQSLYLNPFSAWGMSPTALLDKAAATG